MQEIELPPIGEIVKIWSPYSDFHGGIGFVTDYFDPSAVTPIPLVMVHISGRGGVLVEVNCLKWKRARKRK